ncbi:MAG: hypothetical protein EBY17_20295 [Acidobacteriia bacterium]|nr:hypothetical protein [Terriglobia bacterium]
MYGADPDPRWLELRRIANAAVRAGNFSQLRTALLELQPLMPGNARNAYLMAVAEARLGKPAAALPKLQQWADMGIVLDLAADPNFASLRVLPPFAEILRQVENNQKPISRSSQAFVIAEADLIPEDLAWDPQTKRFFISSVRQAKILTGDGREFARTPLGSLRAACRYKAAHALGDHGLVVQLRPLRSRRQREDSPARLRSGFRAAQATNRVTRSRNPRGHDAQQVR